jgi:hypothetical protein
MSGNHINSNRKKWFMIKGSTENPDSKQFKDDVKKTMILGHPYGDVEYRAIKVAPSSDFYKEYGNLLTSASITTVRNEVKALLNS